MNQPRFGIRAKGVRGGVLLLMAIGLAAACALGEDASPQGKDAIRAVQMHRLPGGNTVADAVATWIYENDSTWQCLTGQTPQSIATVKGYENEGRGDEIKDRTWHAFRRLSPGDPSYRVIFRYDRFVHGDVPVEARANEIRFLYRVSGAVVEPDSTLARQITENR